MLDLETRRRIDTARDILVGKVPDPRSQVEQITFALIYKFMDDMDAEAEELGGERSFFTGEFARYRWPELFRPDLGGDGALNLYVDAIRNMGRNDGLPPLFRDIFDNAALPYHDKRTLREFLRVIDQFEYDHSERLGDAFEYLLSIMGAQGDAGQFRTPRHLIDFIVAVVDPQKHETVLDPACGTAGFLVSAWKHMRAGAAGDDSAGALTPDERARIARNVSGYDISPDMVRLSRVNLYLHGFASPRVHEYDTLTSDERWNERADVILANPPFMSPKGGIRPHGRFSIDSKRSEALFVDYIAEHLSHAGRAGVIVPEGVVFQRQKAYRALRRLLLAECLVAVVSLPAGVFKPYSGVKTSILLLDRALARRADGVAFLRIANDGFELGDQRRPIEGGQLDQARTEIVDYLRRLRAGESIEGWESALGMVVSRERIATDENCDLSGERYRDMQTGRSEFPMVPLGEVSTLIRGITFRKSDQLERASDDSLRVATTKAAQESGIVEDALYHIPQTLLRDESKLLRHGDILISTANSLHLLGRTTWVSDLDAPTSFGAFMSVIRTGEQVLSEYLFRCLRTDFAKDYYLQNANTTTNISNLNHHTLSEFKIPLPPLEVQHEIVAEIEGYQRVIDGARAVVAHYRPHIPIDASWPLAALGDIATVAAGNPAPQGKQYFEGEFPFIRTSDVGAVHLSDKFCGSSDKINQLAIDELRLRLFPKNTILFPKSGASTFLNHRVMMSEPAYVSSHLACIIPSEEKALSGWVYSLLCEVDAKEITPDQNYPSLRLESIKRIEVPLPPLETQRAIVAELEAERALVEANRELIARMDGKIAEAVARVWGGGAEDAS